MKRAITLLVATLTLAAVCLPFPGATPDARKVKIVLERLQNSNWTAVDPGLVFDQGDRIRFRVTTNFDGYLYVVNYGTSGNYSILFPSADAGSDNKITTGQPHQIPSGSAIFRVAGPAGQEIVYWMVSPIPLPGYGGVPVPQKPKQPAILMPRCDDSLLRARGECIDSSAGVRDLQTGEPEELDAAGKPADLTFLREDKKSVIAAAGAAQGPMVYEFRISHK
ncbi:MAG TPA: DUF4384 domain-containing protein [Bryobacteraceae bacterium]|jgi:hypothetical protein|nr:DUF4384 domain-containing protein [Bryobacteraceae bacterium]